MAPAVTGRTVVSYTAFPPLPAALSCCRRFISVALALESPPPDVIRHPALRSPDFPHPLTWPRLPVLLTTFSKPVHCSILNLLRQTFPLRVCVPFECFLLRKEALYLETASADKFPANRIIRKIFTAYSQKIV